MRYLILITIYVFTNLLIQFFICVQYTFIFIFTYNYVSVINNSIQWLKLLWLFDGFLELEGKHAIIPAPPLVELHLAPQLLVEEDFMDGNN